MERLFKGYIETVNKAATKPFKDGKGLKTYESIRKAAEYAGVLADNVILIDVDDRWQAELLKDILGKKGINCPILGTERGKHFYFKQPDNNSKVNYLSANKTNAETAIGLKCDIKLGIKASYGILKISGVKRPNESIGKELSELPIWLIPAKNIPNFTDFGNGDGRNQALFNYILTLQQAGMSKEECRETINIINEHVLKSPLEQREIDTILRDDSFKKEVFFKGQNFLFDKFALFMMRENNIINIDSQLHIYQDGAYIRGGKKIESKMIKAIPNLNKTRRNEVMAYLELLTIEQGEKFTDAHKIAFGNGVYDLITKELLTPSPMHIVTNKIKWDYKPDAYCELTDKTLDKLANGHQGIRLLLEEMIGYCFYRRNIFGKAFMLLGDKSNGKSTLLDIIEHLIGTENKAALDLKELSSRFKSAELYGKLANIGDDIGDEFISDMSIFKKLVTGESINAERKGLDPFEFHNYAKLIFSANNLPRINDKTGAVLRRLVIIPFMSEFGPGHADYNPNIKYDLKSVESMEYLARLGIEGLERIISNKGFTDNELSNNELEDYAIINNPILDYFSTVAIEEFVNNPTEEFYKKYKEYCVSSNYQPESKINFCKRATKNFRLKVKATKFDGKTIKVFAQA